MEGATPIAEQYGGVVCLPPPAGSAPKAPDTRRLVLFGGNVDLCVSVCVSLWHRPHRAVQAISVLPLFDAKNASPFCLFKVTFCRRNKNLAYCFLY